MASKTKTDDAPLDELDPIDDIEDIDDLDDDVEDPPADVLVDDLDDDEVDVVDDVWVDDDVDDDETDDVDDDDDDDDEDEDEDTEDLDELETEELEMLTEDELAETLIVDEAQEMRAIRRAEIAMSGETGTERSADEFLCRGCFLVLRSSQLADKRRSLCVDCAG
jgi:hypothetical protein